MVRLILSIFFTTSFYLTYATDTMTGILNGSFKTLQTKVNDNVLSPPVIILGSDDRITFEFDELAEDRRYLRYSLTHCDSNWKPSQLTDSEFLDGFNEGTVNDFDYSSGTITHYIHYRITLPDSDLSPKLSGNYLLKVYDELEPEQTLLQARFYVSENLANINGEVSSRTDVDYNDAHQQLTIEVDCARAPVDNIFTDLKLVVQQNGRYDNESVITTPMSVSGRVARYNHLRQLIFPAGNEYRRFEAISNLFTGLNVESVEYHAPFYHQILTTDQLRSLSPYYYDRTQSGRFVIRDYNSDNSDTQADYVVVHFTLEAPHFNGLDVYLDGDLTNRRLDSNSMMTYNADISAYEKTMLLKQGAYNYQYLTAGAKSPAGRTAEIEGDRYQTVNEYAVKVYTRRPGERFDRLIGYSIIPSSI